MYLPAPLAVHSSYTNALASFTGDFVIPAPMYLPAPLAIHCSYISALASLIDNFVIPTLVYLPAPVAIHCSYISVTANLIIGDQYIGVSTSYTGEVDPVSHPTSM